MASFAVILPAAGSATRFGGPRNKLLEPLARRAVIARAVDAFLCRDDVAMVVIPTVLRDEITEALGSAIGAKAIERVRFCSGGPTRAHSVRAGLAEVPADIRWVAVHDAARPLVSQDLIRRTLEAAIAHGAAVPALPVALTIKQAIGPLPARVERTIPRQSLWAMQTPQIMPVEALRRAFENCPIPLEQATDDVQLLELMGEAVWLLAGEERNFKITTRMDLRIAEWLLQEEAGGPSAVR